MTSPRTPRQWGPGDSEPDRSLTLQDQDRDLIAYNFDEARGNVGWRYTWIAGHETYYGGVPWSEFDESFRVAWPLSEVLPETPEPPQVIKASYTLHEETVDVTQLRARIAELEELCEIGSVNQDVAALRREVEQAREDLEEARGWAKHGYEIGQRTCTWSDQGVAPRWLIESYRPVPASQSVPAVPVSSTGGKETGEAAETATEALRALIGSVDRRMAPEVFAAPAEAALALADAILAAGWRPPLCRCEPFDFCEKCWGSEQQREAQIRQLAYCEEIIPSGPEDAEQCPNPREPGSARCADHRLPPLPDSETEPGSFADAFMRASADTADMDVISARMAAEGWQEKRVVPVDSETEWDYGFRQVGQPLSSTRETVTEEAARDYVRHRGEGWLVSRRTSAGPWIEVTS